MQQAPCSCFVELPTRLNRLGNKSFENVVILISKKHSDHGSVCFGLFILSLGFLFVLFSYLFVSLFGGTRTKTRQMCAMHHSRRRVLETRVQLSNTTQKLCHPWQTCSLTSFPELLLPEERSSCTSPFSTKCKRLVRTKVFLYVPFTDILESCCVL